jgi:hypothetical protein
MDEIVGQTDSIPLPLFRRTIIFYAWSQSYASAVKIYNTMGSLARFENRNIFYYFEKCTSLLHTTLAL